MQSERNRTTASGKKLYGHYLTVALQTGTGLRCNKLYDHYFIVALKGNRLYRKVVDLVTRLINYQSNIFRHISFL